MGIWGEKRLWGWRGKEGVDTMGMPASAAAEATASSPSGWAILCIDIGAIPIGNFSFSPENETDTSIKFEPFASATGKQCGHEIAYVRSAIQDCNVRLFSPRVEHLVHIACVVGHIDHDSFGLWQLAKAKGLAFYLACRRSTMQA